MPKKTDEDWMSFSLRLASRGRHAVSPNPMVGACVVRKNRLIACGYHKKFGGPHAERLALDRAGKRTRGATLYVTLEPCGTWKKTPPCAPLIVERGIKKVVIGYSIPILRITGKDCVTSGRQACPSARGFCQSRSGPRMRAFSP